MKRPLLMSLAFPLLVVGACTSIERPDLPDSGPRAGAGGSGGTGGTAGAGGGGSAGSGGSAGTGGAAGSGGSGGSAGAGGSGGARSDARTASSPDRPAPPDGAPPASGGGLCTGGDCRAAVAGLDGFFDDESCQGPRMGSDCIGVWCASGMKIQTKEFKLTGPAGDPSKTFAVTLHVRGVAECKSYQGGQRRVAAHAGKDALHDQWYVGGTPVGIDTGNPWNSQELHVTPPVMGEANNYYMNSCGQGQGESHFTYKLDYSATVKVPGGGSITYRKVDNNCRMIANCGVEESGTGSCAQAHTVEITGSVPPPPNTLVQPLTNTQGARGQFLFIDVTDVKPL
jgi:hypothetical protein